MPAPFNAQEEAAEEYEHAAKAAEPEKHAAHESHEEHGALGMEVDGGAEDMESYGAKGSGEDEER